ncbi:hypothetical protein GSB9_01924 [Flavobacteriaceae bacterium GSB9]|nr:hypothetical protein GSB9_01924 [Flavobacteriaceae bacterium GSB9]
MKKTLQIIMLLTFGLNLSAQNVKIDSKIKVDSTELKISERNSIYYAYCSLDNKKSDSLIVTIGTIGTSTTSIRIDLTDKPRAYILLYSDENEFDGKNILEVEFEKYDLELNSAEFKNGERIMGRIKGKSKIIPNKSGGYQIDIAGEFSHIIGKLLMKRMAESDFLILDDY